MFFQQLSAAAQRAPIVIMVTPEGDHLRVTLQQKGDKLKSGEIALAISVAQSPETLDAELPAAIAEACATLQLRTNSAESVTEQARKQVAQATDAAKDASAKKADKKKDKPAAVAKKKAVVKKPPMPAAKKKAAGPKPEKTKEAKPVKHTKSKPGKDKCIEAYLAYAAEHPTEIVRREAFIKGNPTGRRFERLWGNWEKFIKAASKATTAGPAGDKITIPLPLDTPPVSHGTTTGVGGPIDNGPQPPCFTHNMPTVKPADGKGAVTGIGFTLWHDITDNLVGGVIRDEAPKVGETIKLHDDSEWRVLSVDDNRLKVRCFTPPANNVAPGLPESWPFPVPTQSAAAQAPEPAREGSVERSSLRVSTAYQPAPAADPTPPSGRRVIVTETDECLATGIEIAVETDMLITVPGHDGQLRILDFDGTTIWVEHAQQEETTV